MPPVTTFLIVANVAVFLAQMAAPGLVGPFALWPLAAAAATGGQVGWEPWQLVTYAFLHGGFLHLALNMYALYLFGGSLEQVVGPRRYLVFYLVSVLAAGLTQLLVTAASGSIYPTVGASGGVFGVLLAYAVYFPRNKLMLIFLPIPIPARVFVLIYAAIELFLGVTGTQTGVAHFAHLGGLVGGALMLAFWRRSRFLR
ncbi:MAG: rhomboid family intramembrane serine protease [Burkholderiales bacterium]|nr:rhomboid family intramembrane serine protease [Burkholderiales bacterium]